jgi:hypothetical protein
VEVSAAHSMVVAELLLKCASAGMDGEPNVDAIVDEVVGCCVEHRPSNTLEEPY